VDSPHRSIHCSAVIDNKATSRTEAVSLNKSAINKLDNCIKLAVEKIFNVKDDNIDAVREYCDLPYIVNYWKKDV